MMDKFWKAALVVGGLATVGAFIFWSLYKQWLALPIFSALSQDQTFSIMLVFLGLSFIAFVILVTANNGKAPPKTHQSTTDGIAQRAYVTVSDADVSDLTVEGAPTVAVVIKNTGTTPAYDLTWRATFAAREFPNTQEIFLDRTKEAPMIVLAPGGVLSYKWTFDQWGKEWNKKISEGNAAIFAVGEISYKDAFGNGHFTKYRLIHGGDSMVSPSKFGPDKKGNEAD